MKWIGQHIVDFIARFRSDVYLEDIADGTVADNKFLGLDSNNKIVKEAASATVTDLHSAGVDGSANQLLTDDGDGTVTSEANLTFHNDTLTLASTSAAGRPHLILQNDETSSASPIIQFEKTATGADDDDLGRIIFKGDDEGDGSHTYANILGEIADATPGEEAGRLSLQVAEFDGTVTTGVLINGDTNADGEVDVTIGAGVGSTTTVAGNLNANGEDHAFTSATNGKPSVTISSGGTSQLGGHIIFKRTATGADDQNLGDIYFIGKNDADEDITYAGINGDIQDASDGAEEGEMVLSVASHDGELKSGLTIVSGNLEDEVDATIGNGANSLVTVPGKLSIGTRIDFDSTGITGIQTSAESFSDDDVSLMTSAAIDDRINAAGGGADEVVSTGDHILKQTKVTIDTAGFNGLNSTPVELVAAQGANKVIVPTEVVLFHDRASTQSNSVDLIVGFNSTTSYLLAVKYMRRYMQSVTTDRTMKMGDYSYFANDLTTAVNSNLTIALSGAPTTNCVTSLTVYTSYYVIDIS